MFETISVIILCEEVSLENNEIIGKYLSEELHILKYLITKVTLLLNNENLIMNEIDYMIKNNDIILIVTEQFDNLFKGLCRITSQDNKREKINGNDILLPKNVKILSDFVFHFQRIFIVNQHNFKQSFKQVLKPLLTHYRNPSLFRKYVKINQNGSKLDSKEILKILNNSVRLEFNNKNDLTIESYNFCSLVEFIEKFNDRFCNNNFKYFDDSTIWQFVYKTNDEHIQHSIQIIEECINKYGIENIFLSFNGGKDCTVLLHLFLTVLRQEYPNYLEKVYCLYVQSEKPFPEQEEFINQAKIFYNLEILTYQSGIKNALQETLETFTNFKACFMGTRRTDPYSSNLNVFQMTDSNWPQILRVSPLLDWYYSDIWDYLLYYKVPYCKLYDLGFTSLGNIINTTRNPSLIYYNIVEEKETFLPAFKLLKEGKERNGRDC